MSERKIVLYLEQKTISKTYREFFLDSEMPESDTTQRLRIVDYYQFSNLNPELDKFFKKLEIDEKTSSMLIKKSVDRIILINWQVIEKHLYENKSLSIKVKRDLDFIKEKFTELSTRSLIILKVDDDLLIKKTNFILNNTMKNLQPTFIKSNILVTNKSLRLTPFKYRLYLNDRLLIERYYPVDIESNRMLAETLYLKDNARGTLRIESDFDLQIKRVEVDGQKRDIYSSIFTLPNPDK